MSPEGCRYTIPSRTDRSFDCLLVLDVQRLKLATAFCFGENGTVLDVVLDELAVQRTLRYNGSGFLMFMVYPTLLNLASLSEN